MNWTIFHSKDKAANFDRQAATPASAEAASSTMTVAAAQLSAEARHEAEMQKLIYEDEMPA